MSSPSRKIKRKKERKAAKEARKKSKKVNDAIAKMAKKCSSCERIFDRADKEMIQSWMISVYDDGTSILTCDVCAK